jgi:hypothetical protein
MLRVDEYVLPDDFDNPLMIEQFGHKWVTFFEYAKESNGILIDFFPIKTQDRKQPTTLAEDEYLYLGNCFLLVEALRQHGILSATEYLRVVNIPGFEKSKEHKTSVPQPGSMVYLYANIPEVLAQANLLESICSNFEVHIEIHEYEQLKSALRQSEVVAQVEEWLERLIGRLNRGVAESIYEIIPVASISMLELETERSTDNANFNCFLTLVHFERQRNDVLWIDDRFANGAFHIEGAPTIGINEILKALVTEGSLEPLQYYNILMRLRAANVRFIPLQEDEIVYQLSQAQIIDQVLRETRELRIIKRYIAACLHDRDILQVPPVQENVPNKMGEVEFVIGLDRSIANALYQIWESNEPNEKKRAHAEWVVHNLYLDHFSLFDSSAKQPEENYRYWVATNLARLFTHERIYASNHLIETRSTRKQYFEWVFERIARIRFEVDHLLLATFADTIKKSLIFIKQEMLKSYPEQEEPITILIQSYYEDLPKLIQTELEKDAEFMVEIGFTTISTVYVQDLFFVADDFWQAATKAINGEEATATLADGQAAAKFYPVEQERD